MTKTIVVSDEVYDLLKKNRLRGESLSALIKRSLKENTLPDTIGSRTIRPNDWEIERAHLVRDRARITEAVKDPIELALSGRKFASIAPRRVERISLQRQGRIVKVRVHH